MLFNLNSLRFAMLSHDLPHSERQWLPSLVPTFLTLVLPSLIILQFRIECDMNPLLGLTLSDLVICDEGNPDRVDST